MPQLPIIMQDKEKVAFFDFCGTLVPFQSANAYVRFVVRNYARPLRRAALAIIEAARRYHLLGLFLRIFNAKGNDKYLYLKLIKGLGFDILDSAAKRFYQEEIRPNIIPEVIGELKRLQDIGYRIVIVSGAFDVYLHYFAADYNIADIVSSKLEFSDGHFSGRLSGPDCMGEAKVRELERCFSRQGIYCVAFSDGASDVPLLAWADKGYAVSKRPSWIVSNSLTEFWWNEK